VSEYSLLLRRTLIFLFIGIVAAVAALPWWWEGLLRWQSEKFGVEIGRYQTVGYFRWAVEDVRVLRPGLVVEIDRLEAPHPLRLWLSRQKAGEISAGHVSVNVLDQPEEAAAAADPMSPGALDDLIQNLAPQLPPIRIGSVRVDGAMPQPLELTAVAWRGTSLEVAQIAYAGMAAQLHAKVDILLVDADESRQVSLRIEARDESWSGELVYPRSEGGDYAVALVGAWGERPINGKMVIMRDAWLPAELQLNLSDWMIAGGQLGVAGAYESIRASFDFDWREGEFDLTTRWVGQPMPDSDFAPINVDVAASGNLEETLIESLNIALPGLRVALDESLRISNRDLKAAKTSRFQVEVDLAVFPWLEGTGKVSGEADVTTRGLGWPLVEVAVSAENVTLANLPSGFGADPIDASVRGQITWPAWQIEKAEFSSTAGTELKLTGSGENQRVNQSEWSVELPGEKLDPWLGFDLSIGRVTAHGTLAGTWPNDWIHAGEAEVQGLKYPGVNPVDLSGNWEGEGDQIRGEATATAGPSRLNLAGTWQGNQVQLRADLLRDDVIVIGSESDAVVAWGEELIVRGGLWAGPAGAITIDRLSSGGGQVSLDLTEPNWDWLADWLETPPEIPTIRELSGAIVWDPQAVTGEIRFDGDFEILQGDAAIKFAAISDGQRVTVAGGEIGWLGSTVARVEGALPIALIPMAPWWSLNKDGPINAKVTLEENEEVWNALNRSKQVHVQNPRFAVDLAGTWNRPRGEGVLAVDRITFDRSQNSLTDWPVVTAVEAKLVDDGEGLVVDPVTARIDGQLITLRGELPFTPQAWTELSADPLAYFRDRGRGRLDIPRAQLSAFAKFLPEYLVPTGELEVALSYSPGQGTNGRIQLNDVVSKPLGPLGILQNIEADLRFENRTMAIKSVTALMGGQPLKLAGGAAWPEGGSVKLDLALQGSNLPIVRKTGVLLRSDLDLKIASDATGKGLVSGSAVLRDGLVLIDVRSLVPRGGSSVTVPSRRPPYFSVTAPPLNDWELAVDLRGENFLRLRTPVITGTGSIRAALDGTLENPRLLGVLELREAELKLPFARLEVDEALVRLTEADPYDPEILLQARGQRLGYDLQLELSGQASDPQLDLQSSPSLTAAEVLLLVMAGVTPNDDGGMVDTDRAMRLGMYFGQGILGDLFGTDERGRLTISTGEKLSRLGRETYRFEYEIADRWAVVGEYDEFDYYNAALKWRVRPGKPKPAEPDPEEPIDAEEGDDE